MIWQLSQFFKMLACVVESRISIFLSHHWSSSAESQIPSLSFTFKTIYEPLPNILSFWKSWFLSVKALNNQVVISSTLPTPPILQKKKLISAQVRVSLKKC